jgi:dimethylaniline monooxygenase (N-oxide forming)
LALCTGLHVIPSIPIIPGIEHVLKRRSSEETQANSVLHAVYHSVDYKGRSQLSGRRVMILGTGETGMDLAYEAAKAGAKEVVLCSRSGFIFLIFCKSFQVLTWQFSFLSFPKALASNQCRYNILF